MAQPGVFLALLIHFYNQSQLVKGHILKDTTDFINFIKNTPITDNTLLATLGVSSLYTNIPHSEGMDIVCRQYEIHYGPEPPIPLSQLRELIRLILEENSFRFTERQYIQIHGIAMGTKMAVAFSVIFMADQEERLLSVSLFKPSVWKIRWRRQFVGQTI